MKVELLNIEQFAKQFKDTSKSKLIELLYQACGESLQNSNEKVELQQRIDKAIDKVYCWSEILQFEFKQAMLKILKGDSNE